jgi:hypothetical protein
LDVLKFLDLKEVSKFHLTCKKFHEIATEHHPHTLLFWKNLFDRTKPVDRLPLIPRSRIFDDVTIYSDFYENDQVLGAFEHVFKPIGMHVKKLKLMDFGGRGPTTNVSKFLLSCFPNVVTLIIEIQTFQNYQQVLEPIAVESDLQS